MTGYEILVDELEKNMKKNRKENVLFAGLDELADKYPIPSAFEAFRSEIFGNGRK